MNKIKEEFNKKDLAEIDLYFFIKVLLREKSSFIKNSIVKEIENNSRYSIYSKIKDDCECFIVDENFEDNTTGYCSLYLGKNIDAKTISVGTNSYPAYKKKGMLKDHSLEVDYILRVNFDEKFEKVIGFSYEFRYDSSIYSSFFSYNYKYDLINKIDFLNVDYKIHNEMNFKICEKLNNSKYLEDTFFDDLDLMHDCRNDFFQKELKKSFCKEGFFDKNEDFINFILFKKYNLFKD